MVLQGNPAGIPDLGFTHGGKFHADDVFSAALLRMLHPGIRIYRGFEVPKGFSGIVFDIGNGPFDHHAKGSPRRASGVPYAAFGLLWRAYGEWFLPAEAAKRFDDKFISPLDLDDNTGTGHVIAVLIGAFNPVWDAENPDVDAAFFEAVEVARQLLEKRLDSLAAVERGAALVKSCLAEMRDGVVVLPRYAPWKPVLVETAAEFVVFPSARGGYSVQCIPRDMSAKSPNKVPMPAPWRGQDPETLRAVSGVPGIKFCHASGFMCTTETLEDALLCCEKARDFARAQAEKRAAAL